MQISGLFKSIAPKLKTCGQKIPLIKRCLKADEAVFTSNTALIENKLAQIEKTMKGFLDDSVIKQGISLIREFLPLVNADKMDDKLLQFIKKFKIEDVESNLNKSKYFLSILFVNKFDKTFLNSRTFKKYFKDFSATYKERAPLEIFKTNLLNLSLPLITSTKDSPILIQEKAFALYDNLKFLGLSSELTEFTKKLEEKTGISIIPINDEKLMKRLDEELSIHKSCYDDMPTNLSLIDLNFFNKSQNSKGKAIYSDNLKSIYFNLNSILIELILKIPPLIMHDLKHELGHHLHNAAKTKPDYSSLFSYDERLFLKSFESSKRKIKTTLNPYKKNKIKEILDIEIHKPQNSDDIYKSANVFCKINGLSKYAKYLDLTESEKKQLAEIEEKAQKIQKLVLKEYRLYALRNSDELVADAFANSNMMVPSPEMQEILNFFKMPELKDRSYLPQDHPVIKLIKLKTAKKE